MMFRRQTLDKLNNLFYRSISVYSVIGFRYRAEYLKIVSMLYVSIMDVNKIAVDGERYK